MGLPHPPGAVEARRALLAFVRCPERVPRKALAVLGVRGARVGGRAFGARELLVRPGAEEALPADAALPVLAHQRRAAQALRQVSRLGRRVRAVRARLLLAVARAHVPLLARVAVIAAGAEVANVALALREALGAGIAHGPGRTGRLEPVPDAVLPRVARRAILLGAEEAWHTRALRRAALGRRLRRARRLVRVARALEVRRAREAPRRGEGGVRKEARYALAPEKRRQARRALRVGRARRRLLTPLAVGVGGARGAGPRSPEKASGASTLLDHRRARPADRVLRARRRDVPAGAERARRARDALRRRILRRAVLGLEEPSLANALVRGSRADRRRRLVRARLARVVAGAEGALGARRALGVVAVLAPEPRGALALPLLRLGQRVWRANVDGLAAGAVGVRQARLAAVARAVPARLALALLRRVGAREGHAVRRARDRALVARAPRVLRALLAVGVRLAKRAGVAPVERVGYVRENVVVSVLPERQLAPLLAVPMPSEDSDGRGGHGARELVVCRSRDQELASVVLSQCSRRGAGGPLSSGADHK